MKARISRLRCDEGASLIIALVIVTVIALVIGATLSQASGSELATVQLRNQAGTAYAADAAGQVAVNNLRRGNFANVDNGTGCFGNSITQLGDPDRLHLNGFYPGANGAAATSATVVCRPEDGTGAQGSPVPITNKNKPGNAILTLGQNSAETGINIKPLSSKPFRVHGGIVSDSNIVVTQGSLDTNSDVFAHTGCTGTITSLTKNCSAGTVPDPNYQSEADYAGGSVPPYQSVPTTCPGGVVTFSPGYYDDAQALSTLMKGNGTCKGSTWWFTPGTYYFDFHNNPLDPSFDPAVGSWSGGDTWTVNDGTLVAGTPINAAGQQISKPPKNPAVPGACWNPIDSVDAVGVQFIFGGDSQLAFTGSANGEICGTYHKDRPPIAVYSLKSGTDTTTTLTAGNSSSLKLTSVTPGDFTNATVANLANGDKNDSTPAATYATWTSSSVPSGGTAKGKVTLSGYTPPTAIPAGSVLKSAVLRVIHREPAGAKTTKSSVTATVTPNLGTALAPTPLVVSPGSWQTENIDMTSALAADVHTYGFNGASIAFAAAVDKAGNEDLDTVQLDLTYIAPAFRGETTTAVPGNCLTATYTGGSAGQCAVLSTATSYAGAFFVQGTTYTPAAVIDLTLNNLTSQVLRFGVICRSLWVKETGSLNYEGPVIEIPDDSPGYGTASTVVDLEVFVCPGAGVADCPEDASKLRLTGRVQFYDPDGEPNGNRQVAILGWSQIR